MRLWDRILRVLGKSLPGPGEESFRFGRCPICRAKWVAQDQRGNIRCANNHKFGPDAERGELFNDREFEGEI